MSNVIDFYKKKLQKTGKKTFVCFYCRKPFDCTGWKSLSYTCNMDTGEHKPLVFVVSGNVLKPQ